MDETPKIGTCFAPTNDPNTVWEVNTGLVFDGEPGEQYVQAELIDGPEDRLGEMDLFTPWFVNRCLTNA